MGGRSCEMMHYAANCLAKVVDAQNCLDCSAKVRTLLGGAASGTTAVGSGSEARAGRTGGGEGSRGTGTDGARRGDGRRGTCTKGAGMGDDDDTGSGAKGVGWEQSTSGTTE